MFVVTPKCCHDQIRTMHALMGRIEIGINSRITKQPTYRLSRVAKRLKISIGTAIRALARCGYNVTSKNAKITKGQLKQLTDSLANNNPFIFLSYDLSGTPIQLLERFFYHIQGPVGFLDEFKVNTPCNRYLYEINNEYDVSKPLIEHDCLNTSENLFGEANNERIESFLYSEHNVASQLIPSKKSASEKSVFRLLRSALYNIARGSRLKKCFFSYKVVLSDIIPPSLFYIFPDDEENRETASLPSLSIAT